MSGAGKDGGAAGASHACAAPFPKLSIDKKSSGEYSARATPVIMTAAETSLENTSSLSAEALGARIFLYMSMVVMAEMAMTIESAVDMKEAMHEVSNITCRRKVGKYEECEVRWRRDVPHRTARRQPAFLSELECDQREGARGLLPKEAWEICWRSEGDQQMGRVRSSGKTAAAVAPMRIMGRKKRMGKSINIPHADLQDKIC